MRAKPGQITAFAIVYASMILLNTYIVQCKKPWSKLNQLENTITNNLLL